MWKRILFGRSGGYWLFYASALYLASGLYCAVFYKEVPTAVIQISWLAVISMPFYFPPLGRWLNMNIDWDKKMLDFFGKKSKEAYSEEAKDNVYNLPKPKAVPEVPQVKVPEKEKPAVTYYRLGLTNNNRVSFQMGYSEITMNSEGCQQLIDQIEFFQSQLYDEGGPTDDPDGGLPLPEEVENKKAA